MSRPAPTARELRSALGLLALAALGACSSAGDPAWISLAHRLEGRSSPDRPVAIDLAGEDGRPLRLETRGSDAFLVRSLRREEWHEEPVPGLWRCAGTIHATGSQFRLWPAHRLADSTRSFTSLNPSRYLGALRKGSLSTAEGAPLLPSQAFLVEREHLYLQLQAGEEPTQETTLHLALSQASKLVPGRVRQHPFSGDGFALWPGQELSWTLDLPPASALRLATAVEPLLLMDAPRGELVIRIELDGEELLALTEADLSRPLSRWHALALPPDGRRGAHLSFSVAGRAAAQAWFLAPLIGPDPVGRAGQRPWKERRPDVVLFLADTFRADNLESYGGTGDLTPNLDGLAWRSRCFLRAWSVATYTLPAHVSLFSGLFPLQAGIATKESRLPDELVTLAECLAAQGYRTGAVTDGGYVSPAFGLDRGFEYFDEHRSTLEGTFQRALDFLAADDGRPVFLFVHTYRVHGPYEVSEETRASHGKSLGIAGTIDEVMRELRELAAARGLPPEGPGHYPEEIDPVEAEALVRRFRAQYLGGVVDLDRGFGAFLAELERRGLLDSGYLIFTSDHGEAFAEHGELGHWKTVFEEQTRIPLLLAGRGIEPALVEEPASLVDLPVTVVRLCGARPPPSWPGSSLLALPEDRPIFSFQCERDDPGSTLAIVSGGKKLIGFERPGALRAGELRGAYDLVLDPREQQDLAASGQGWPAELLRRLAPTVEPLLAPVSGSQAAELDPSKIQELEGLGYGGGER